MINKFNFNSNRSLLLQYTSLGFQWFRSFYIRSRINCCNRQQCNMDTAQKKPPHIHAWGNCSRCRDVYSQRRHNPQSPTAQGLSQFPGRMRCCLFTKSCRASSWVPCLKTWCESLVIHSPLNSFLTKYNPAACLNWTTWWSSHVPRRTATEVVQITGIV